MLNTQWISVPTKMFDISAFHITWSTKCTYNCFFKERKHSLRYTSIYNVIKSICYKHEQRTLQIKSYAITVLMLTNCIIMGGIDKCIIYVK